MLFLTTALQKPLCKFFSLLPLKNARRKTAEKFFNVEIFLYIVVEEEVFNECSTSLKLLLLLYNKIDFFFSTTFFCSKKYFSIIRCYASNAKTRLNLHLNNFPLLIAQNLLHIQNLKIEIQLNYQKIMSSPQLENYKSNKYQLTMAENQFL